MTMIFDVTDKDINIDLKTSVQSRAVSDSDPGRNLNTDPDPVSQSNADPDLGLPVQSFGDVKYEYTDIFFIFVQYKGSYMHIFEITREMRNLCKN